ncbi:MAG: MBL fold metallo-hydrolase [Candidatus Andersenbacteria bacterium]
MTITWHGEGMVKLVGKTDQPVTLVFDPYTEKETGLRPPRPETNVVLVSAEHADAAAAESLAGQPFVITGPGEYDVKGMGIRGIPSFHDGEQGKKLGRNTIYVVDLEGITVCHLGCLGHALSERQIDEIGNVDVLLIPVGGDRTIGAKTAVEVVNEIEPRIVIPTHYAVPKLKYKLADVAAFLKEMGASGTKPEPRLKLKKSDLPKEETRVVLLERE